MENDTDTPDSQKKEFSSTQSMFPLDSNEPLEPTSPDRPPPYANPSLHPPPYGMPYSQDTQLGMPGMSYPQPGEPPPDRQPYYPQPGFVNPGLPVINYLSQQQQMVMMSNQGSTPVIVACQPPVSMVGAIVLSCFVTWFCLLVCGFIAFILASKYTFRCG